MNRFLLAVAAMLVAMSLSVATSGQATQPVDPADAAAKEAAAKAKSDADHAKRAADWVASLQLTDKEKGSRVREVVLTHLLAVRDWHNSHPYTIVPEGINPATGKKLGPLDRQVIAESAMPATVHDALMTGLRADLSEEQVEAILDKYTEGKVAFTLKGFKAIVPDLTAEEEATILAFLKEVREQAVDYKGSRLISAIFEIYKTKSEQYLISRGRDWKKLYKSYTDEIKARKAAASQQATTKPA